MNFRALVIAIGVSSASLAGCASTRVYGGSPEISLVNASELPAPDGGSPAEQAYDPTIGVFDTVTIDVVGIEELSNRQFIVDGAGNITLPIAGQVRVAGVTTAQAAELIAQSMRRNFVRNPQVGVNFHEITSNYLTIQGSVELPGNYPALDGMTLTSAIAAARGFNEVARTRDVIILRTVGGRDYVALYDMQAIQQANYADPRVFPKDRIIVGESSQQKALQRIIQGAPLLVGPIVALLQSN